MPRKKKTFESKTLRNRYIKKLKNKKKMVLSISDFLPTFRAIKRKYSVTWWEKPKGRKRK